MADITLKLDTGKTEKMFKNTVKAISNFKPALRDTRNYQLRQIKIQFDSEGSHITSKGQKLAQRTIIDRLKAGFAAGPILKRTGRLKRSFKASKLNNKELNIGSNVSYFAQHQQGGGNIPRRQILAHSNKMIKNVLTIFQKFLTNTIKNG